jgi:hypothetical protein
MCRTRPWSRAAATAELAFPPVAFVRILRGATRPFSLLVKPFFALARKLRKRGKPRKTGTHSYQEMLMDAPEKLAAHLRR